MKLNASIKTEYYSGFTLSFFFILILIYFALFPTQVTAQKYRFENITSNDGLSQNLVHAIFQDSRHFLWIGTASELNRYDGNNFKIYKENPDDPKSIGGFHFKAIVEDKNGNLWIGSVGGGLSKYVRMTDDFIQYKHNPSNPNSIPNDRINSLIIDRNGFLWIGTDSGLSKLDTRNGNFTNYRISNSDAYGLRNEQVNSLLEDTNGNIWIGTWKGVYILNPYGNTFINYIADKYKSNPLKDFFTYKVFEDWKKNIWIGTSEGLFILDETKSSISVYRNEANNDLSISNNVVRDILEDRRGNIWLATNAGGLNLFDREKNVFQRFINNPLDPYSISSDNTSSLAEDDAGSLWIGTLGGGLNKIDFRKTQFNYHINRPELQNSLSSNKVSYFYVDDDNSIWIATLNGGLNHLVRKGDQNIFTRYPSDINKKDKSSLGQIFSIAKDRDQNLWLGMRSGLKKLNKRTGSFLSYDNFNVSSIMNNSVFSLLVDHTGTLWIGSYRGGLSYYDKTERKFVNFIHEDGNANSLISNVIRYLYEDSRGIIWICTENGLDAFNPVKKEFTHFVKNPKDANSLFYNVILLVFEDSKKNIWIGTPYGLGKMIGSPDQPGEVKFIRYSTKDGLSSNNIHGIQEDAHGNLWISTIKGISKYNPETNVFSNYNIADGLLSNEFYVTASAKISQTGEMIFGGDRGFYIFHPDSISDDPYVPPVVITGINIENKPVNVNQEFDGNKILTRAITETKEIYLNYKQNNITIEFAALNFTNPLNNSIKYKMEGLDDNWHEIGNQRIISFINLSPGRYTLKLKAANHGGKWNGSETSLNIIISPPLWETLSFRLSGSLLLLGLGFFFYRFKTRSMQKKEDELQAEVDRQTKELRDAKEMAEDANKYKSDFLANTSHELRTPLNAILGYAQILRKQPDIQDKYKEHILTIQKSGEHLLTLINDILDLRRMEVKREEVIKAEFNLHSLISEVIGTIRINANDKNLLLEYRETSSIPGIVIGDSKKIRQILLNLLGNSVKYTKVGFVRLEVKKSNDQKTSSSKNKTRIIFIVSDSGIGIEEDRLAEIFQPFSRKETTRSTIVSSGLGLSISKKLAELMGGKLGVSSKVGKGTTFTLEIDLETKNIPNEHRKEFGKTITNYSGVKKKILIVDDNPLNVSLLVSLLKPIGFNVVTSENGRDALLRMPFFHPNLILLDLLMPGMDGYEFIQKIRIDKKLSDIKIIGISAAVSDEHRIDVFSDACDDFISKPINTEILLEKIGMLLKIDWIIEGNAKSNLIPNGSKQIVKPPMEILESIKNCASMGDYSSLNRIVKNLSQQNEYREFSISMLEYIKKYDEESIITLCSK